VAATSGASAWTVYDTAARPLRNTLLNVNLLPDRGAQQPCLVDGVDCARHALQPGTCPGPIRGEQP